MVHTNTTNNIADVGRALALEEEICLGVIPINEILRTVSTRETHISKRAFGIIMYMADMIETLEASVNINLGVSKDRAPEKGPCNVFMELKVVLETNTVLDDGIFSLFICFGFLKAIVIIDPSRE
jgi:hypothetical protein